MSHVKSTVAGSGVIVMTLDLENGLLTSQGVIDGVHNPTWLCYSQRSGTVYAASEIENGCVSTIGGVDTNAIMSSVLTRGNGCVHCGVSPDSKLVAVA